ncbi:MAG TPA: 3'(2'),5'-bisphosphate nucleotidase CysQ [Acidimicrobiales bacterium]|nr:3'(2'),5'-bisphosphate nucleotidase CysQ [Acidimicrobiales bacterium]
MSEANADDHRIAADVAAATGKLLVELRADLETHGVASWRLMDEGDMRAHHFIVKQLTALRPGDAILSEEGRDGPARLSADRVWVVDPLDGTNEFGQPGRSDWAVHIALAVRGEPVVGAVALPALGVVYSTGDPPPPPPPLEGRRLRVITSRSRSSHAAAVVAHSLGADIVTLGSAGAKAMAVVTGEADIYAHSGGQYEWDNAAPAAVAMSAGLHVSRLDGTALVYNRADPWLPDLLICRKELAEDVLTALWG